MPRFDSDLDYYEWHRGPSEYVPRVEHLRGIRVDIPITHRDPGDEDDRTPHYPDRDRDDYVWSRNPDRWPEYQR